MHGIIFRYWIIPSNTSNNCRFCIECFISIVYLFFVLIGKFSLYSEGHCLECTNFILEAFTLNCRQCGQRRWEPRFKKKQTAIQRKFQLNQQKVAVRRSLQNIALYLHPGNICELFFVRWWVKLGMYVTDTVEKK